MTLISIYLTGSVIAMVMGIVFNVMLLRKYGAMYKGRIWPVWFEILLSWSMVIFILVCMLSEIEE